MQFPGTIVSPSASAAASASSAVIPGASSGSAIFAASSFESSGPRARAYSSAASSGVAHTRLIFFCAERPPTRRTIVSMTYRCFVGSSIAASRLYSVTNL